VSVTTLPIWKKNAPAHERLYELAELAREKPDFFQKWVLVYCEDNDKRFKTRLMEGEGTRTSDSIAVLQAGILTLWEESRR
jgi:hypothetical protein